jgi:hypothetical protein
MAGLRYISGMYSSPGLFVVREQPVARMIAPTPIAAVNRVTGFDIGLSIGVR